MLSFLHGSPLICSGFTFLPEPPAAPHEAPLFGRLPGVGLGCCMLCRRPPSTPAAPQRGPSPLPLPSQEHLPCVVIRGSTPGVAGPGPAWQRGARSLPHW